MGTEAEQDGWIWAMPAIAAGHSCSRNFLLVFLHVSKLANFMTRRVHNHDNALHEHDPSSARARAALGVERLVKELFAASS
jgi:hypothetical protein